MELGTTVPLLLLLLVSLSLNLLLVSHFLLSGQPHYPTWLAAAAAEAAAVAATPCSAHGRAYLDSPLVGGRPSCECNTCYAGPDCSLLLPNCSANAESGDPVFLEPYWREQAAGGAVVMSPWHRMSYSATGVNYISLELERHIRLLHRAVGNAVVDGRFIVFGTGSTQLVNAALNALSPGGGASSVVASVPYYQDYKVQTELFDSKEYSWQGITSNWMNSSISSRQNFIEFVTSPNNPDGCMKQQIIRNSTAIHDHVYYWPHFTSIQAPVDEDIMLFSTSKLTGHASSRFGWAIVKDESVYRKMLFYVGSNTMGVSRDAQLRVLQIFKAMLANIGEKDGIFEFGYNILRERWRKLNALISLSNRFSLEKFAPQFCNYFKKIKYPSPAYAWLKCEMEKDKECHSVLREARIMTRNGIDYGADSKYVRLSLIKTQDDFDQLLQHLEALVFEKNYHSSWA